MSKKLLLFVIIVSTLLLSSMAMAQGTDVTAPGDIVQGVPNDGLTTGGDDNGWPPNEIPPNGFDDQILTKFLHFKGNVESTGLRVTPAMGPTIVTGLTFTTANDSAGRDPVTYELSGSNDSIDGPYTLIAEGPIVDFAGSTEWPRRTINETPIQFNNTVSYKHYQIMFPTTRDAASNNSMQVAEIELLMRIFKASEPAPANKAIYEDTWATLSWTKGHDAVSHDVYMSENLADVANSAPEAFQGNLDTLTTYLVVGFAGFPIPDGLVPGTTYYWRVDEINNDNPESPWVGDIWSFTVPPRIAWKPTPPNGGQYIGLDADLSWRPGWGAKLHTVYFGDNFDDVNSATGGVSQIATSYSLDPLELNKTYYWRVDESDGRQAYIGDVWSFTTTDGGGGIKGEYFANETLAGTPTYTQIDPSVDFEWAESPGLPLQNDNWSVRWTADLNILVDDTYTFSVNSEGGTRLWIDDVMIIDMWVSWVATKYASVPLDMESGVHSLRLEFVDFDRNAIQQLYWSSTSMDEEIIPAGPLQPPLRAQRSNPRNGGVDVKHTQILTWVPGDNASLHQVYFGADEEAVKNANTASPEYKGSKELGDESYDPGLLEWNTDYFWRIDEVNDLNPASPWVGAVWSFKAANFLVIDDFEDYDIGNTEIWWFWKDGLGYGAHDDEPAYPGNGTGSAVGDEGTASYMEETIVHGGGKSMPVYYNNTIAKNSEVELTLGGLDLTKNGCTTLKIWFSGIAENAADTLYVTLNGIAVLNADPAAAQATDWTELDIPLQAFVDKGVDVTNVNSIAIGIGDKTNAQFGGTGTMYFDDIGVHPPAAE